MDENNGAKRPREDDEKKPSRQARRKIKRNYERKEVKAAKAMTQLFCGFCKQTVDAMVLYPHTKACLLQWETKNGIATSASNEKFKKEKEKDTGLAWPFTNGRNYMNAKPKQNKSKEESIPIESEEEDSSEEEADEHSDTEPPVYVRTSKKRKDSPSCCLKECSEPCGTKVSPVITIGKKHVNLCLLNHFKSSSFGVDIKQMIQPLLEKAQVGEHPLNQRCSFESCAKKCSSLLAVHGNVTVGNPSKCLYFCNTTCLLDHMKLVKTGSWKKLVNAQE